MSTLLAALNLYKLILFLAGKNRNASICFLQQEAKSFVSLG